MTPKGCPIAPTASYSDSSSDEAPLLMAWCLICSILTWRQGGGSDLTQNAELKRLQDVSLLPLWYMSFLGPC